MTKDEVQWLITTRRIGYEEMIEYMRDEDRHRSSENEE